MFEGIIRMFKEKDGFVSGEEMSRRLGITRAAIWKKVKALREKGYVIEGSTAKGYRLIKTPEFSVEELKILVKGDFGKEIIFRESLDSTNTLAMELAEKGVSHGTVVIADRQLKRQREGSEGLGSRRSKGNIYMSVLSGLRSNLGRMRPFLTIMSAISCARAIGIPTRNESFPTGLEVNIKWPTDPGWYPKEEIRRHTTEMKSDQDRIVFAVIGIGINVNASLDAFPSDVRAVAASATRRTERERLFSGISKDINYRRDTELELERWFKVLIKGGRIQLINEMEKLSSTLGRKVKIVSGKDTFSGIAEDIDEEGMLILRLPSGGLKKISAGDVIMLR